MKKIIVICLVMVMALCISISAFATSGGFVSSPSGNQAPELVEGKNESEDCEAEIIISAYSDRHDLSEESRKKIEEAYAMIVGTEDLSHLNSSLADLADELGVKVSDFAVSDMFDISATECNDHEDHGHFDITLKADTLKNFVCLLHYYNGEWRIVDNAKVTNNGQHLEFDEDEFSPFAIVVNTGASSVEPQQDANGIIIAACIAAAVIVIGALVILGVVRSKKKKSN